MSRTRKDEWGHKASPCSKLKCLIVNNLWHCTNILLYIKILTIDWQIKGVRYTIKKNLVSLLSWGGGVATFGMSLLSGFTSGHKKLTLFWGRRYFRGVVTVGTLRVVRKSTFDCDFHFSLWRSTLTIQFWFCVLTFGAWPLSAAEAIDPVDSYSPFEKLGPRGRPWQGYREKSRAAYIHVVVVVFISSQDKKYISNIWVKSIYI